MGNGKRNRASATNAATAMPMSAPFRRLRDATRTTADVTMASTAGATPAKSASIATVSPSPAYTADSAMIDEESGQHEERPGDQPADRSVQEPADVDGQLLRLGPGKEHAVVEGVQEPPFPDPAQLVDQRAVHDRDLAGRAAERLERNPEPCPQRRSKGNQIRRTPPAVTGTSSRRGSPLRSSPCKILVHDLVSFPTGDSRERQRLGEPRE